MGSEKRGTYSTTDRLNLGSYVLWIANVCFVLGGLNPITISSSTVLMRHRYGVRLSLDVDMSRFLDLFPLRLTGVSCTAKGSL